MSVKFENREIEIGVGSQDLVSLKYRERGRQKISAVCAGPLAIHDTLYNSKSKTITHIPTGFAFSNSPNLTKAKKAVRLMLAAPIDWDELTLAKCRDKKIALTAHELKHELSLQGLIFQSLI